jgi:hypothetical protein
MLERDSGLTPFRVCTTGELKEGFGNMPVDSENKACALRPWTFSFPHMVSFHCSWLGFFVTFVSTFAAAPMVRAPPSFKPTSSNTNGFAPPQMTPATPIASHVNGFFHRSRLKIGS